LHYASASTTTAFGSSAFLALSNSISSWVTDVEMIGQQPTVSFVSRQTKQPLHCGKFGPQPQQPITQLAYDMAHD
jgi:hypothetical protein